MSSGQPARRGRRRRIGAGAGRVGLYLINNTLSMKTAFLRLIAPGIVPLINLLAIQAKAQFVYESTRMGQDYKVYIYKKYNLGDGKWKFQTKAVFKCGAAAAPGCQPGAPYISEWSIADCWNSTIDGNVVPATARFGYEEGMPDIFKSVCRL